MTTIYRLTEAQIFQASGGYSSPIALADLVRAAKARRLMWSGGKFTIAATDKDAAEMEAAGAERFAYWH